MDKTFWLRFLDSHSDNRKPVLSKVEGSKTCAEPRRSIQNLKFCVVVGAMLLALGF